MHGDQLGFELPGETATEGALFDPNRIRAEAKALIAEARAVGAEGPWDGETLHFKKLLFPHLVSWLPDPEERRQLCFEFEQESKRIEALLAA
jgi:hypothetical protein